MTSTSVIQNRLHREHRSRKHPITWRAIADRYGVNVQYVYNLAEHGIEPKNPTVRRLLGLPRLKPPRPVDLLSPWVKEAADNLQRLLDQKVVADLATKEDHEKHI
jgi:hypothetical protein